MATAINFDFKKPKKVLTQQRVYSSLCCCCCWTDADFGKAKCADLASVWRPDASSFVFCHQRLDKTLLLLRRLLPPLVPMSTQSVRVCINSSSATPSAPATISGVAISTAATAVKPPCPLQLIKLVISPDGRRRQVKYLSSHRLLTFLRHRVRALVDWFVVKSIVPSTDTVCH